WLRALGGRPDADAPAVLADPLVHNVAGHEREQSVVATEADARSRRDLRAALADEDGAGAHDLAAINLHSEHLGLGIAAVAGGAASFLMCHWLAGLLLASRSLRGLGVGRRLRGFYLGFGR